MRFTLALAVAGLALAASPRAQATLLLADFSGTVASQTGTSYGVGGSVSGSFVYDTTTGAYDSFTIGGYSLPAGAFSSYAPPALSLTYSAQYEASQTNTGNGSASNTTLSVDLTSDSGFNTADLVAFTTSPGAYVTDPTDPFGNSTISYTALDAGGSIVAQINANLTSFAAVVPEPASLTLLATGALGLLARRRRAC